MSLNNRFESFFLNSGSIKIILLSAWIIRLIFFFISELWIDANVLKENFLGADSEGYHILAVNLLNTGSFETFGTFRTPGYPVYISFFYSIFGFKPWIILLSHTFIDLISAFLVFKIGQKIFNTPIGLITAIFFAFDPHIILFGTTLQSDNLFVCIFLFGMYIFMHALENSSLRLMLACGLILGIATLIRPILQFFPAVIFFILLFNFKLSWISRLRGFVMFILAFLLAISPWLYRNYSQYNHIALSSIQGANLLFYSASYVEVIKTGKKIVPVRKEFSRLAVEKGADERYNPVFPLTEEEHWNFGANMVKDNHNPFINATIYNQIAVDYIKNNLDYYIPRHLKGIRNMYLGLESRAISFRLGLDTKTFKFDYFASPGLNEMIMRFISSKPLGGIVVGLLVATWLLITYSACLFGLFQMVKDKRYFEILFLIAIIGYYSALVGVVGLSRYKMPFIPFYLVGSAYGIYQLRKVVGKRKKPESSLVTY